MDVQKAKNWKHESKNRSFKNNRNFKEVETQKGKNWNPKTMKKPFNKNNKYKANYGSLQEGHGVAFLQKNKVRRNYILEQKKEKRKSQYNTENDDESGGEDPYAKYKEDREVFDSLPSKKPKLSKLGRARKEYQDKINERERWRKEKEERIKEIEKRKKISKEKRFQRHIKFTQKTKKGQPIMRSRMEVLLQDVEKLLSKG